MCGHVSPFEQNFGLRKIVGSLYWNVRIRNWFRPFWQHAEADVFWYRLGPFTLLVEPK